MTECRCSAVSVDDFESGVGFTYWNTSGCPLHRKGDGSPEIMTVEDRALADRLAIKPGDLRPLQTPED